MRIICYYLISPLFYVMDLANIDLYLRQDHTCIQEHEGAS
jgi:hypothetical protein